MKRLLGKSYYRCFIEIVPSRYGLGEDTLIYPAMRAHFSWYHYTYNDKYNPGAPILVAMAEKLVVRAMEIMVYNLLRGIVALEKSGYDNLCQVLPPTD